MLPRIEHGSVLEHMTETLWARFDRKYTKRGPDECWPWTKAHGTYGHGLFRMGTRWQEGAHRLALARWLGRDLTQWALHTCDNPPCVNPAHLYEGTRADNLADMERAGNRRGRYSGLTHCKWDHPLSGDNLGTWVRPNGKVKRYCKTCHYRRGVAFRARQKVKV